MKKILYTTLFSLLALSLGSCVNEVEEVFDTPASDRLEQAMKECKELLTAPEYGWLIEYYPDVNQSYGGFTYAAKFESNGDVTVAFEMAEDPTKTITSHYSVNASSSAVLTFDTYNEYIHYFSDPDQYGGNAWGGDFEWAYVSGDASRMIFRGTKTGNTVTFTPLAEDPVASVATVAAVKTEINDKLYTGFEFEVNGETVKLYAGDSGSSLNYYPTGNTEGEYETYAYAYTSTGFSLFEPLTAKGITVQRFAWDGETETFTAEDAVSATGAPVELTMKGWYREGFIHYNDLVGSYKLRYKSSQSTSSYSNLTVQLVKKVQNESYYLVGLHSSFKQHIEVTYSKSTSGLALDFQQLGPYNGKTALLAIGSGHSFYTSTGTGFNLVNISETDQIVFDFVPMGSGTDIYLLTYSGGYGLIKGFYYVDTLTKQ